MITKEIAEKLGYHDELHHVSEKNADGTPVRCRVNGKCKTWKARPNDFRLPVKYGKYNCFYIEHIESALDGKGNAREWEMPK